MNKDLLKNIKVLYVEDEIDVREFTGKTISAIVKEVIVAENGKEGLELFEKNQDIDLIVTDINMPKMGGLEMCTKIKEINDSIPIVITSAHNDSNFLKKAIDVGVTAYSMKPIDLYQLIENMVKAVEPFYLKKQLEELNLRHKNQVDESVEKIKTILDSQNNLIIITNGILPNNSNKKFLEFFNVSTLEDFSSKYTCISRLFINEAGYYSYNEDEDEKSWIMQIKRLPNIDRIVKIKNSKNEEFIFSLNIDNYINKNEHFVISFTDITDLKKKSNLLEYQSKHDVLTGLFNKQKFYELFEKEIRRVKRYKHDLSLIFLDLDFFRNFNKIHGHQAGDIVLKSVANLINSNTREHDSVIRWGGEKFIVLLPETDIKSASLVAKKIKDKIESYEDKEIPEKITVSFGITTLKENDDSNIFIKRAEESLKLAKESGKNTVKHID